MHPSIRLMIVSERGLHRQRLAQELAATGRFVVSEHSPDHAGLEVVERRRPDVVLIDVGRSSVRFWRERVSQLARSAAVILLGTDELASHTVTAFEEGARGWVSRSASQQEIVQAIDQVLAGEAVCPPQLAYAVFQRLQALAIEAERMERIEALKLSARELEILELVVLGYSNKKIADRLCLSIYTVKNHLHRIFGKLDVSRRSEAILHAAERRWFPQVRLHSYGATVHQAQA